MGKDADSFSAWHSVNIVVLKAALDHCKKVTLDIDATEIIAHKASAKWTYKKNKGYMPMMGHITQTGQVLSVDFREGNASPAKVQDVLMQWRAGARERKREPRVY